MNKEAIATVKNKMLENPLLKTGEAAEVLGLSPATLNKMRCVGGGPKFCKAGGSVKYRFLDLQAWLVSRTFSSTSEIHGGKQK